MSVSVWCTMLWVGSATACGMGLHDADERPVRSDMSYGSPVVNDAWQIVKMATANGVFTIEVELVDLSTSTSVARMLVTPLMYDYSEVLVYVYENGQGRGGHRPAKRIRWTSDDGFDELDYRVP